MNSNWPNFTEPDKPANKTRLIGMILLGLGLLLGGWVVVIIYQLISGEGTKEIVSNLIPTGSITVTMKASSEVLVLPDSFFHVVGLFFCVLLLAICGGLAKVLIASGVKMLQSDLHDAMDKLRKDILEWKNKRV